MSREPVLLALLTFAVLQGSVRAVALQDGALAHTHHRPLRRYKEHKINIAKVSEKWTASESQADPTPDPLQAALRAAKRASKNVVSWDTPSTDKEWTKPGLLPPPTPLPTNPLTGELGPPVPPGVPWTGDYADAIYNAAGVAEKGPDCAKQGACRDLMRPNGPGFWHDTVMEPPHDLDQDGKIDDLMWNDKHWANDWKTFKYYGINEAGAWGCHTLNEEKTICSDPQGAVGYPRPPDRHTEPGTFFDGFNVDPAVDFSYPVEAEEIKATPFGESSPAEELRWEQEEAAAKKKAEKFVKRYQKQHAENMKEAARAKRDIIKHREEDAKRGVPDGMETAVEPKEEELGCTVDNKKWLDEDGCVKHGGKWAGRGPHTEPVHTEIIPYYSIEPGPLPPGSKTISDLDHNVPDPDTPSQADVEKAYGYAPGKGGLPGGGGGSYGVHDRIAVGANEDVEGGEAQGGGGGTRGGAAGVTGHEAVEYEHDEDSLAARHLVPADVETDGQYVYPTTLAPADDASESVAVSSAPTAPSATVTPAGADSALLIARNVALARPQSPDPDPGSASGPGATQLLHSYVSTLLAKQDQDQQQSPERHPREPESVGRLTVEEDQENMAVEEVKEFSRNNWMLITSGLVLLFLLVIVLSTERPDCCCKGHEDEDDDICFYRSG